MLVVSLTLVYGSAAFYVLSPRASEPFIGFGVFSDTGTLSNYLPGNGLSVKANQTVDWHLRLNNRMGTVQFVKLVFRLGNLTTESATEGSAAASVPQIGSLQLFVADQDTSNVNFTWRILASTPTSPILLKIQIGQNSPFWASVGAVSGHDFRLMFELWTFDASSGLFQYGWKSGSSYVGTPLQIWFDFST